MEHCRPTSQKPSKHATCSWMQQPLTWVQCLSMHVLCCGITSLWSPFVSNLPEAQPWLSKASSRAQQVAQGQSEDCVSAGPRFMVIKAERLCNCSSEGKLTMPRSSRLTHASYWATWEYISNQPQDCRASMNSFDSSALVPLLFLCLHRKVMLGIRAISGWSRGSLLFMCIQLGSCDILGHFLETWAELLYGDV